MCSSSDNKAQVISTVLQEIVSLVSKLYLAVGAIRDGSNLCMCVCVCCVCAHNNLEKQSSFF